MEKWKKQLRKIPLKSRQRILATLEQIFLRDFATLDRLQLKDRENIFRVRVGDYRIIYYDDGSRITLKAIRRRNESTYNDF